VQTLFFPSRTGASFTKGDAEVKTAWHCFIAGLDNPPDAVQENGTDGGQGKAAPDVGLCRAALLFVGSQNLTAQAGDASGFARDFGLCL
jgi:hypothetical protein